MTLNNCLITVGITCFNAEKTIENAINSALNQLWSPLEILVVDDFSKDNGFEILKRMANQYKEIRVFRNSKNRGVAYSRNKIIENSKGQFLSLKIFTAFSIFSIVLNPVDINVCFFSSATIFSNFS